MPCISKVIIPGRTRQQHACDTFEGHRVTHSSQSPLDTTTH